MKNCWEVKQCGRQPGGPKAAELGICSASRYNPYSGRNRGIYAGRYCWRVVGTLCDGEVQGSFALKIMNCAACEFFQMVKQEEGSRFQE
ncbi:hypothetical protein BMS3Abin05_01870 [bacterium BMS3Abin05]|nr:hypothetical protein BMS3Abin05_01870 [bacterium BMS3Abin05]GBE28831.1 hypothetical protein BMS3Bbin03_02784 [bacterium BMS3Bbin03]HDZ11077.1 hypothetical protein [Bacteroidota bacterium]